MTALHEPNSIPPIFSSWEEWREHFEYVREEYCNGAIDRVRLRAQLVMMNYVPGSDALEREMNAMLEERTKRGK